MTILFVCTGNVCRSPMAEYLLRFYLGPDSKFKIESAGTCAVNGAPASIYAVKALSGKGVDATSHQSRNLTEEIVLSADMIVAMTKDHVQNIKTRFPDARDKAFTLRDFGRSSQDENIQDPIGSSQEVYQNTCKDIEEALLDLIVYLQSASTGHYEK